ncbi:MAG: hypothetical protein EBS27_03215 [Actinobacteria bacterium]|nr:hypothetical protein [Actinomycetota bacterium]
MSRLQLALNVENLEESIAHYSKLFGVAPAKVRPGYANFAVVNPPLKLVLIENPGASDSINHLGVEVESVDAVRSEHDRVTSAGLPVNSKSGASLRRPAYPKVAQRITLTDP